MRVSVPPANTLDQFQIKAVLDALSEMGYQASPPGIIVEYDGSTVPAGWLDCDGSAVSRKTYAALFNEIGTTYGAGDGSTTFNLPLTGTSCDGDIIKV